MPGLTGRASHVYVVHQRHPLGAAHSGGRLFGPFDGASPAQAFRAELVRAGVEVGSLSVVRLWSPAEVRESVSTAILS